MVARILGKRAVDFTAEDGRKITGTSVYLGFEQAGVEGLVAEKYFIGADIAAGKTLIVGNDINVFYNSRGRIDTIVVD